MFTLNFDTDNAAFDPEEPHSEMAAILNRIARRLVEECLSSGTYPVRDTNGNTIGSYRLELKPQ